MSLEIKLGYYHPSQIKKAGLKLVEEKLDNSHVYKANGKKYKFLIYSFKTMECILIYNDKP